jgi:UDP-N-acetylmuramoylalanine--D-glutamate ligase
MPLNMTNPVQLNNDHVLVVGMGLTGYSVVKHLVKLGVQVTVADSRALPPYLKQITDDGLDVEIITGDIPFSRFPEFSRIVTSPGIDIGSTVCQNSWELIGDIELFVQQADSPIIAITGSNGKSTVTMLVSEMLLAAGLKIETGGNIGTPVLDLLDRPAPDFYVLELSSFQLETTHSLSARVAVVLNISEDHMDRYCGLADYAEAKRRIFKNAAHIVLNRDDLLSNAWIGDYPEGLSFGLDSPSSDSEFGVIEADNEKFLAKGETRLAGITRMTLLGDQNLSNVLAAMALLESAGVGLTQGVIDAALGYGGLPHRCEIVSEVNGVRWINDSKGTNVGATVAAIQGFQQNLILIAGGKGKGANFSPLAEAIQKHVYQTILFGEDAELISNCLDQSTNVFIAKSLEESIKQADSIANPGSVVLFSPACASFDMFDNFEHRGNAFKQLVWERVH